MPDTDGKLLAAAQSGDRKALNDLLERLQDRVFRFGMKMCGREEDAQDVLQETLLAAARNVDGFRGASSVSTWLYTIARSFCIKSRRTSKFAPRQLESLESEEGTAIDVADPARGPEEHLAGRQVQDALGAAIGDLDPMYREVLVLRDVEGLSASEVAEVTGFSVEAVKSRLHRARAVWSPVRRRDGWRACDKGEVPQLMERVDRGGELRSESRTRGAGSEMKLHVPTRRDDEVAVQIAGQKAGDPSTRRLRGHCDPRGCVRGSLV
jgi:RNA polymerase sigma factor (sigma-70 family)